MNTKEIIKDWLVLKGYDGLYWANGEETCGCGLDDLMPCGGDFIDECVASRKGEDGLFYPVG